MEQPIIDKQNRRSGLTNFLKYLVVILNFFMLIAAFGSLAIGIWIVVDKRAMEYIVGSNLYTSSAYILIAVGAWMLVMSFVGCFGAWKEVRCILLTYFVCLLILLLMMAIAGILGFVFKNQVNDYLQDSMLTSLRTQYGQNNKKADLWVTEAWDYTQTTFSCCSVTSTDGPIAEQENFRAWQNSTWFKGQSDYPRERVPKSCCVLCRDLWQRGYCDDLDKPSTPDEKKIICERECPQATDEFVNLNMCQGTSAEALLVWPREVYLNIKGCYPLVLKEMRDCGVILGAIGVGVSILLTIAMVCSVCLYRFLD